MSEFYIGQKVVCVNISHPPTDRLKADAIYTIFGADGEFVTVEEESRDGYHGRWFPKRFRPLDSKAISIFRKIAADATEHRKVTVSA